MNSTIIKLKAITEQNIQLQCKLEQNLRVMNKIIADSNDRELLNIYRRNMVLAESHVKHLGDTMDFIEIDILANMAVEDGFNRNLYENRDNVVEFKRR